MVKKKAPRDRRSPAVKERDRKIERLHAQIDQLQDDVAAAQVRADHAERSMRVTACTLEEQRCANRTLAARTKALTDSLLLAEADVAHLRAQVAYMGSKGPTPDQHLCHGCRALIREGAERLRQRMGYDDRFRVLQDLDALLEEIDCRDW